MCVRFLAMRLAAIYWHVRASVSDKVLWSLQDELLRSKRAAAFVKMFAPSQLSLRAVLLLSQIVDVVRLTGNRFSVVASVCDLCSSGHVRAG